MREHLCSHMATVCEGEKLDLQVFHRLRKDNKLSLFLVVIILD